MIESCSIYRWALEAQFSPSSYQQPRQNQPKISGFLTTGPEPFHVTMVTTPPSCASSPYSLGSCGEWEDV